MCTNGSYTRDQLSVSSPWVVVREFQWLIKINDFKDHWRVFCRYEKTSDFWKLELTL